MKKYRVNRAEVSYTTKTGFRWVYHGSTDNPQMWIESYQESRNEIGLRITDNESGSVFFEDLRSDRIPERS